MFDQNDDTALNCYKQAVTSKQWNATCDFSKVEMHLNVQSYYDVLQAMKEDTLYKMRIIVDNTPLPAKGANASDDLTTMLSVRTNFKMNYNIKTLTIYAGLLIISLSFATCGVIYLYCKTRADYNSKRRKLSIESDGQF